MTGGWRREILAVLRKEFVGELRNKSGLLTAGLFSVVSVVGIAYSTMNEHLAPTTAAGLYWVTLLFSAMIALPRTFTAEEEQGTGDLLRLMARPHAVFWGKVLFNLIQMLVTSLLLAFLFIWLARLEVRIPWLFFVALFGSCAALAGGVTLSGALVAQAANRAALAGAVALPLLLPIAAWGVSALRVALGEGSEAGGVAAGIGLSCYGLVSLAVGPYLFAAVWKS